MRAAFAVMLLAACVDFTSADAEFCDEHRGVCPDAGSGTGGGAGGGAERPQFTAAPRLSGFPQVAQTLVASPGSWSSALPVTSTYSWFRCALSDAGSGTDGGCVAVRHGDAGYTLDSADLGWGIRARVQISNGSGQDSADTELTAPVRPLAELAFVTGFEHGVANVPLNSSLITPGGAFGSLSFELP